MLSSCEIHNNDLLDKFKLTYMNKAGVHEMYIDTLDQATDEAQSLGVTSVISLEHFDKRWQDVEFNSEGDTIIEYLEQKNIHIPLVV